MGLGEGSVVLGTITRGGVAEKETPSEDFQEVWR